MHILIKNSFLYRQGLWKNNWTTIGSRRKNKIKAVTFSELSARIVLGKLPDQELRLMFIMATLDKKKQDKLKKLFC